MQITMTSESLDQLGAKCLVVLANKNGEVLNGNTAVTELLKPLVESGEFGKSFGGSAYLFNPTGVGADRLLIFNIGEKVKKSNDLRRATARIWKGLRGKNIVDLTFSLDGLGDDEHVRAAVEGFILSDYQYNELKSDKDKLPPSLKTLTLHSSADYGDKVAAWHAVCRGTCRARDLSIAPANILNPTKLANLCQEWSDAQGYSVTVLEEDDMRKEGMGSLLSVGHGSDEPSKLIIMEYNPANPSGKTVALVGKAVTFDSGGLSLKPGPSMPEMKGDMGGGAAVVGIMTVLKEINFPHRVVGLVPSVENMPSARATRPSDVVTSLSGITIEINNTDAEGRLILADALTYAKRYNPDFVIDFATLTGACLVALGPKVCGVMGNHQGLVDAILKGGDEVHEPFWQLPLVEEYDELLKSSVADVSNIGSTRWGGTITAGLFLQRFAKDFQWAHCDIAAAIFEKADDYNPVGGTGIGVRMAVAALQRFEELNANS